MRNSTTGRGEVRSLKDLYERYSGPVFGYLLRLSGNKDLAEDITDETFYRAMLALDGFRGEANVKTWLIRIARNLYLKRLEKAKHMISLDDLREHGGEPAAGESDPEHTLIRKQRSEAVEQALAALSESDRTLLLLSALEGMRFQEIATVLGISVTAAKVRMYRARRRFADALRREHMEGMNGIPDTQQ